MSIMCCAHVPAAMFKWRDGLTFDGNDDQQAIAIHGRTASCSTYFCFLERILLCLCLDDIYHSVIDSKRAGDWHEYSTFARSTTGPRLGCGFVGVSDLALVSHATMEDKNMKLVD